MVIDWPNKKSAYSIRNAFNDATSIFLPQINGLKRFILIYFFIVCSVTVFGQTDSSNLPESTGKAQIKSPVKQRSADSSILNQEREAVYVKDSLKQAVNHDSLLVDSIQKASIPAVSIVIYDTSTYRKYEVHAYLPLNKAPVFMIINYHHGESKDDLFYLLAGIIFLLAFIRVAFSKYFRNLFLLFFQTSLRQKQTRDQLLQDNLASLLSNLLFIVSAGLYITLLIRYKHWIQAPFWWLAAGSAAVLLLTYLVKYLFLLFSGWVFNTKEAAGSYVFVVFLVNKVLGVMLIPFLMVLAFSDTLIIEVSTTICAGLVGILLLYRYWVSYMAVRNKLKVNPIHFFLYLCAVELLPLILIYKVLINYLDGSF
jgi:hypothetical protein